MIPTRQMCEQLWDDMHLSDHLKQHLTAVANLSVSLGEALNTKGYSLNIPTIEAAALLHDIKKGTPHHDIIGAKVLETLGYTEIAPIVRNHMRLSDRFEPEMSEYSVVFLADKLLMGTSPVTLKERYSEKILAFQNQPLVQQIISDQLTMSLVLEKMMQTVLGENDLLSFYKVEDI